MNIRSPEITKNVISKFAILSVLLAFVSLILLAPTNISAQIKRGSKEVKSSDTNSPDILVPDGNLRLLRTIPLGKFESSNLAVNPDSVYSNVTTSGGMSNVNGGAADQAGNIITRLVADDLAIPATVPLPVTVTQFLFSVANQNSVDVQARPRIRFYQSDGAGGGPGTLITGFTFNPITFSANSAGLFAVSVNPAGYFSSPTRNIWAGMTFDNDTGGTGATLAQMDLLGQLAYDPVDRGTSADNMFRTTAAGSFFASDPAGAQLNLGGVPVANFGWEIVAPPVTAALAEISGRVLSPQGRGIPRAIVHITHQNGDIRTALTNQFGYYRFEDIEVGQTLVFNVFSKSYQFTTQVVNFQDSITDLNFIAQGGGD